MANQKALFAVGSTTRINGEDHTVTRYHRVRGKWEVMFHNKEKGKHVSIPLTTLETHYKLGEQK